MTSKATFKQSDLDRAIKCAARHGLTVARIDINDNGASIVFGEPDRKGRRNPLDRLHAA